MDGVMANTKQQTGTGSTKRPRTRKKTVTKSDKKVERKRRVV